MSRYFFIFIATLVPFILQAQPLKVVVTYEKNNSVASNIIFYQPGSLLSWNDFKGKPLAGSDAAALTNAGFGIDLKFRREGNIAELLISVNCNFSRKDSWVKPGNNTPYILNHEQKHFDIAYLYTLEFMRKLANASLTNANYVGVIEKIYKESATALLKQQNQYDLETSHSRIREKQEEWDQKISHQINAELQATER